MGHYKIGEVAKLIAMTTRTIRYYEELGLLRPEKARPRGKARTFDDLDISRLKKIQRLKELGLSLEEIAEVIDLYFTDGRLLEGKQKVIEILRGHMEAAEEKIKELAAFRDECQANIGRLERIVAQMCNEKE